MKDPVENRDFLAQMEVRGQLVQQAQAEARVIQVLLEVKVPQAPRGLQGLWKQGNWKQCVFKNLHDKRDSGLVKVKAKLASE